MKKKERKKGNYVKFKLTKSDLNILISKCDICLILL